MSDMGDILTLVERWRQAELDGNAEKLSELLAAGFIGVGPLGWIRTKAQWVAKYRSGTVSNEQFDLGELNVHPLGAASVVVVTRQSQTGTNGTTSTTGQFRFSLTVGDDHLIHSIHVTRIVEPQ